ncbi:polysaccharide pyruvyl transferase family protein [Lutibacter sp.]|uniref:polysaccharide pyruvyl transferase family protein n=1 Tax=Lutibacter sp. TaxID=1925666 RepID=UPI001A258D4A|nr:polysaccharide pyruvyl transferase family protein [Lutibacter sp.]MBI9042241.1 polysaccharide pyruvyl transferase family protein [Lutibacter sp.]
MLFSNKIRLFWWNEIKIQGKTHENYGDLIGAYLVEKIANKKVVWVKPSTFSIWNWIRPIYVTAGSILTHVNRYCIVWGSGIISKQYHVKNAQFLAVRGPKTRAFLLEKGCNVPEIYGDPALLLPNYYQPTIEKKYEYGIIPHYNDMHLVKEWFKGNDKICIINLMTNDVASKTNEILRCKKIVSSSLHGIIVAHTYQIPAVWQKFSDKVFGDNIKYEDYMESVALPFYQPSIRTTEYTQLELEALFTNYPSLPTVQTIEQLKKGLMDVCPFKSKN